MLTTESSPQGRIADFVVKEPMVIGHESAGWARNFGSICLGNSVCFTFVAAG